jgi:predicted Zn-dependent peptidase
MLEFEKFQLDNGLTVIVHPDTTTPIVAVNILYNVGARDEDPNRTGFAHLFEHLMFGGSVNIPKYDVPLENAGGENNAFTNNDITNYYLTIPKQNLELAFWLESDRMLELAFSEKSLEVQRNVVIEEYKQSYLNQPYGDIWLLLRPLAYKIHPYQWPTIGKDISHIERASMQDVKDFYKRYYHPGNAIMTVAGNITKEEIYTLANKWFGEIPGGNVVNRSLPSEPKQLDARKLKVERNVPVDAIYMAFHMCARNNPDYHAIDLTSDILSNGNSARLYEKLVKQKPLFSDINAFISGDQDPGLFMVTGKLNPGVKIEIAEEAINEELNLLQSKIVKAKELQKVKNKVESTLQYSNTRVLNRAINLSLAELMGDANLVNTEMSKYEAVSPDQIKRVAKEVFNEDNCSTIYYRAIQK